MAKLFPSPVDWRDTRIYFDMIDRFDNPTAPPHSVWDRKAEKREGESFAGIGETLAYLKELGVGAIWLTSLLKNRQSPPGAATLGMGS